MSIETQQRFYTPAEYLELEEHANFKSEYRSGEIVAMTGGTTNHNKLALNIASLLKAGLRGQAYDVYIGDVRLWMPRHQQYTYPDVMVIGGEPVYEGSSETTVVNPLLIVEVLSKSTQSYDQSDKFLYYRSVAEFQEYILIDQYQYRVMQYAKNANGKWTFDEIEAGMLLLQSIDLNLSLADIYERVLFN